MVFFINIDIFFVLNYVRMIWIFMINDIWNIYSDNNVKKNNNCGFLFLFVYYVVLFCIKFVGFVILLIWRGIDCY